jgi:hypothetical protein
MILVAGVLDKSLACIFIVSRGWKIGGGGAVEEMARMRRTWVAGWFL